MEIAQIKAPFTDEQVKALNEFQHHGRVHPFTCCSPEEISECLRAKPRGTMDYATSEGMLIATNDGWVCPCGKYTQEWAHEFMTQKIQER